MIRKLQPQRFIEPTPKLDYVQPMHHRTPSARLLSTKQIRADPDFLYDDFLLKTYKNLDAGNIKVALTRLPESEIVSGYFVRSNNKIVSHITNLRLAIVPQLAQMVRSGMRPSIDVYWSPHAPSGGAYVCAEDENMLAAYRSLGIIDVPCRVLRPSVKPRAEAAIWLEKEGEYASYFKSVPPVNKGYPSLFGTKNIELTTAIKFLKKEVNKLSKRIMIFHQDGGYEIHYHQMIYAFVNRHVTLIDSISKMIKLNRQEHAMALLRMAYEGFLNFYLDWISPQFFGPRFQLLSALRAETVSESDQSWRALANFPSLLENVSNKARLSPLGSQFHDMVYPTLSDVVHQSYKNLEIDSINLIDNKSLINGFENQTIIQCLDILTTVIILKIQNDIGAM